MRGQTRRKRQEFGLMIDEKVFLEYRRSRRRFELRDLIGPVLCGLAGAYLLTAALLGLLAR